MPSNGTLRVARRTLGACMLAVLLATCALASSRMPPPIARYTILSDVSIDVQPRTRASASWTDARLSSNEPLIRRSSAAGDSWPPGDDTHHALVANGSLLADDSLRLSFRAFSQLFHLHLSPNRELLHPDGTTVNYYATDPAGQEVLARSEKLYPGDVRAYHGVVVHPAVSRQRLVEDRVGVYRRADEGPSDGVVGSAAIVVHDDGLQSGRPSFEGSFDWMGNRHYVQLAQRYESFRQPQDPPVTRRSLESGHLIVHRESDSLPLPLVPSLETRGDDDAAASVESGCSTDRHDYNLNNRLFRTGKNDFNDSWSPMSFFATPPRPRRSLLARFGSGVSLDAQDLFARSAESSFADLASPPLAARGWSYDVGFGGGQASSGLVDRVRRQGDVLTGGDGQSANSFTSSIGSTAGCPTTQKVVYIGAAGDCNYVQRFPSQAEARTQLLNTFNTVSSIYRSTFNVSIGVVQLEVRDGACPSTAPSDAPWNSACSDTVALDRRLTLFSQWRGARDANGTGLWHLLTTCSTGSEVGVAWLGTLCKTDATNQGSDTISGTGVSAATTREAQVVAHEIGHNFGAIHDCEASQQCRLSGSTATQSGGATCCPLSTSNCDSAARFIMSPVSQTSTQTFSPCSVGNVCSLLGRGLNTNCVLDPGSRATLSPRQCGNGILEPGEQCDAGPNGSNCCTADCKLTSGSRCDPTSSSCCTGSCQFAAAGTVCRPSKDATCDPQEVCTGNNATCPVDVTKPDGDNCGKDGNDQLQCASGHCTSRSLQCKQQGSDLGLSAACSSGTSSGCSVSCQSPNSTNACVVLQQYFVDGTPCGLAGRCEGGQCKSGGGLSAFDAWYRDNLRISIPVTIAIAIVVLVILFGIVRCCCVRAGVGRGAKRGRYAAAARSPRNRGHAASAVGGGDARLSVPPPPPPPMRQSYPTYDAASSGQTSSYDPPPPAAAGYNAAQPSYPPPHFGGFANAPAPPGPPPPPPPPRSGGQPAGWVDPYAYNGRY